MVKFLQGSNFIGEAMSKEKSTCFTGHRIVGSDFNIVRLRELIDCLIQLECYTFITGGALGFDTIVAKEVLERKRNNPAVQLHVYVPCNNQDAKWSERDKKTYKEILKAADYVDIVDRPYFDGCMQERNYKMVDNASRCICYYTGKRSGTSQTVFYAKRQGLQIFNTTTKEVII